MQILLIIFVLYISYSEAKYDCKLSGTELSHSKNRNKNITYVLVEPENTVLTCRDVSVSFFEIRSSATNARTKTPFQNCLGCNETKCLQQECNAILGAVVNNSRIHYKEQIFILVFSSNFFK